MAINRLWFPNIPAASGVISAQRAQVSIGWPLSSTTVSPTTPIQSSFDENYLRRFINDNLFPRTSLCGVVNPAVPCPPIITPTGGGGGSREIVFNLAAGGLDLSPGTNLCPPRVITNPTLGLTFVEWMIKPLTPSVNAALVVSIRKNGTVFLTITVPNGSTTTVVTPDGTALARLDYFNVDCVSVGTGCQKVFIVGRYGG